MQERLSKMRNEILSRINEAGGLDFIDSIKDILYEDFMRNPFSEFLILNLNNIEDINVIRNRTVMIMESSYKVKDVSENIIIDYIRYKLESEGFYCIYMEDLNCFKIKI